MLNLTPSCTVLAVFAAAVSHADDSIPPTALSEILAFDVELKQFILDETKWFDREIRKARSNRTHAAQLVAGLQEQRKAFLDGGTLPLHASRAPVLRIERARQTAVEALQAAADDAVSRGDDDTSTAIIQRMSTFQKRAKHVLIPEYASENIRAIVAYRPGHCESGEDLSKALALTSQAADKGDGVAFRTYLAASIKCEAARISNTSSRIHLVCREDVLSVLTAIAQGHGKLTAIELYGRDFRAKVKGIPGVQY